MHIISFYKTHLKQVNRISFKIRERRLKSEILLAELISNTSFFFFGG